MIDTVSLNKIQTKNFSQTHDNAACSTKKNNCRVYAEITSVPLKNDTRLSTDAPIENDETSNSHHDFNIRHDIDLTASTSLNSPIADHQGSKIPVRYLRWTSPYVVEKTLLIEIYIVRKTYNKKTQILLRIRFRNYTTNTVSENSSTNGKWPSRCNLSMWN